MKYQLPELTPKSESWDKILERVKFDNQLKDHLGNLHEFTPDEQTWSKIERHLEEKKGLSVGPFIKIAAGLTAILLASAWVIYSWNPGSELKLETDPLINVAKKEIPVTLEKTQLPKSELAEKSQVYPVISSKREEIQVATLELPEIEFYAIEGQIFLPEPPIIQEKISEPTAEKTLHEVTISWGLKSPKLKIGTSFGRQDPFKNQELQSGKKSRRIRFGQDN